MNQILQVERNNRSSNIDTKKIVLFFAVAIILIGLIILGEGAYTIYKAKINEKVKPNNGTTGNVQQPTAVPNITLTKTDDGKLVINIESEIVISHIIYSWNSDAAQTIDETGKTNIEEIIDIPNGENNFNISVIDANGIETKKSETFETEQTKPEISLSVIGNDIKITVTSKVDLASVSYKWNLQEEQKDNMVTYENKSKFEKSVEIPKGQNTLKIIAIDTNGNSTEKSQDIKGVTKAKTTTMAEGEYLGFTVTGDENIKKVEFEFNGNKYVMDTSTFGETNTVHYKMKMIEGWNFLKVISTTKSDAVDTSIWKYEYKVQ